MKILSQSLNAPQLRYIHNFIIHAFRTKNLIKKNDEYRT